MNLDYVPMIDTSRWQFDPTTLVDWKKAYAAGVRVNMIRAGKGNPLSTSATTDHGVDKYFNENVWKTIEAGLDLATYWRVDNLASETGSRQADRYATLVEGLNLPVTVPLVIDVESYVGPQLELGGYQNWLESFRARLHQRGHRVAVYTSKSYWDTNVKLNWGETDLIVAHWVRDAAKAVVKPLANAEFWPGQAYSYQHGPAVPIGWDVFDGWQFSNIGDGATLGSTVNTVDCNILTKYTYGKWFA